MKCYKIRTILILIFIGLMTLLFVSRGDNQSNLNQSSTANPLPIQEPSVDEEEEVEPSVEEGSTDTEDTQQNQSVGEETDYETDKEELIEEKEDTKKEPMHLNDVNDDDTAKDQLLEQANDDTVRNKPIKKRSNDEADEDHVEETSPSKQILLVANFRTGSSFLGDILQSSPGAFYSYEPLYFLDRYPGKKTELIRSIFYCQFSGQYLKYINGIIGGGDGNFMRRNLRAWKACEHNQTLCYQPDFIDDLCSTFPIRVIKVVRLRVKELVKLLEEDPNTKDWKIIYLMRDPRGTMASRAGVDWCGPSTKCGDVTNLCHEMMDDMKWIKQQMSVDPEHHYLMKFEDMSADVDLEVEKLFNYLEIPFADSVRDFLKKHTRAKPKEVVKNEAFSITKDTKAVASSWKTKLTKGKIAYIERVCEPIMKWLGYEI